MLYPSKYETFCAFIIVDKQPGFKQQQLAMLHLKFWALKAIVLLVLAADPTRFGIRSRLQKPLRKGKTLMATWIMQLI
jgi:hypothetical protein